MQLGLAIKIDGSRAPTGREGALLDADFVNDRFWYAGTSLPGFAAFRTAVGGTNAPGGELLIGPHLSEDATELITNGDFSEGVGAWQTNGGALAIVDGALQATGIGGNTTNTWLPIHTLISPGRAYRLAAKVRRGTTNNVHLGFGAPVSTHNYSGSSNITATTMTSVEIFCGGLNPGAAVIAVRHIVNPSTGTYYVDDVSLKEVTPLAGLLPGQLCGRIEAVTPTSGESILFQADDNATYENAAVERNFIRLVWGADGHLRFIVSYGGTGSLVEQANLDLGEVAPETPFTMHFSAQDNNFKAALEGRPVQSDTSGSFPGLAVLRLGKGRSNSEKLWGGSIDRMVIWPAAQSDNEFLAAAAGNGIAVWGDSLTVGTGASTGANTFPSVAEHLFTPPRAISRQAVGGQTSTQIAARMNALPVLVTLEDDLIPASGSVAVTAKSINILGNSGAQIGWLVGIKGTMTSDASGNWTFTRLSAGDSKPVAPDTQFVCELGEVLRPRTTWLWLGRNGAQSGHTVLDDIVAAVASLGHSRYLVGSVLTPTDPDDPASLNAQLAAIYGSRFVNVLQDLIDANDGSPEDLEDVEDDFVPASLRSDATHLNDAGYAIVAASFHAAHVAMGW